MIEVIGGSVLRAFFKSSGLGLAIEVEIQALSGKLLLARFVGLSC